MFFDETEVDIFLMIDRLDHFIASLANDSLELTRSVFTFFVITVESS